jgi:uncharacterized membrane-anchored protein
MRVGNIAIAWMLCAAFVAPAGSQEPGPQEAGTELPAAPAVTFQYQSGDIVLPNKVATLRLGERFRYMSPAEANRLLQLWGNPPDSRLQGAVVAANVDPMQPGGWAVFLTYVDDGHVDDSDAAEIDYEELLSSMKDGQKQGNEARKAAGYESLELVGWAEPPHYDATAKKLYWAKHISSGGGSMHTLNYDVRVLGREGVLSMEAVALMDSLPQIREEMEPLLKVAEFNPGFRYADFNEDTDRVAAYGLGALIAGVAAAKLGLFAKLWVFLLPFKKFLIFGVVALGALVARLWKRKKDQAT